MQVLDDQLSEQEVPQKPYKNYSDRLTIFAGFSAFLLVLFELHIWCSSYEYAEWLYFVLFVLWINIVGTLVMALLMSMAKTLGEAIVSVWRVAIGGLIHAAVLVCSVEAGVWEVFVFLLPNIALGLYVGAWLYFRGTELPWKTAKRKP